MASKRLFNKGHNGSILFLLPNCLLLGGFTVDLIVVWVLECVNCTDRGPGISVVTESRLDRLRK